jgi:diguanylate cyclase (GGDEF)-like protein
MSRVSAERFLQVGMPNLRQALRDRQPVPFDPASALLLEAMLGRHERLVFVPVVALRKPIGVLALLGHDGNGDLKDGQLLRGIGIALGLSLENLRQKEELREMAAIDELTKVYNRRYFFEQLEREMAAAQRYDSPLALLIVDLDGLKYINDNYGHSAGDGALRTVAQCLVRLSRAADLVARLGGDEFAVILPRTDKGGAADIGARLQQAVSQSPLYVAEGVSAPLTISCGCGAFPEDAPDIEGLLRQADGSMYCGKAARRTAASR